MNLMDTMNIIKFKNGTFCKEPSKTELRSTKTFCKVNKSELFTIRLLLPNVHQTIYVDL